MGRLGSLGWVSLGVLTNIGMGYDIEGVGGWRDCISRFQVEDLAKCGGCDMRGYSLWGGASGF